MSIEKNMNARIQHKHDIEANWNKALNFIPKIGEIIVYDIDENYNYSRFKIGDGVRTINNLEFLLDTQYILHNSNVLSQLLEQYNDTLATKQPVGDYALKSEIPKDYLTTIPAEYVTETELNAKGYLTSYTETDPTVPAWAKEANKPTYTASEVGALPADTVIPTVPTNVSAFINDAGYLTQHQSLAGYATETYANIAVSSHNIDNSAHNDIRLLIEGLTNRLNALADSDDTTLDQMSEIVAYIKSNKSLIEDVTTNKVNVTDIVNNLTTNVTNKPLSAAQGVAIKGLIDALQEELDSHTHTIEDVSGLQSALDGKANSSHGTHVTYSTTAPVMDGTASAGSATTVARSDHKHPTDTSRASKIEFDTHVANMTKHITSTERTNWNAAKSHADSAHAPSNAEANQNAFSNIAVSGQTTIAADSKTDTLTLAGSNVNITTDANNDKVTFSVADGTTSAKGVVQLTNSISSTSTTTAATPNSVKSAYDLANQAKKYVDSKADTIQSASGEVIAVNNSAYTPLKGLKIFGKTEQRTTTGKNLLNYTTVPWLTSLPAYNDTRKVAIKLSPGEYVLTIKTNTGKIRSQVFSAVLEDGAKNSIKTLNTGSSYSLNASAYFTLTEEEAEKGTVISLFYNHSNDSSYVSGEYVTEIQIEKGSTATAYEPYTGGIPSPSPEYPQALKSVGDSGSVTTTVCGKNLLNNTEDKWTSHGITFTKNADGSVAYSGVSDGVAAYYYGMGAMSYANSVLFKAGSYIFSVENNDFRVLVRIVNEDGSYKDICSALAAGSFTLEEDCHIWATCHLNKKVQGQNYNGVIYPMIRLASIADDTYEPYTATTATVDTPNGLPGIPVTSGGNYTDETGQEWICDEVDFEKGVYVQRVGTELFDGSSDEAWTLNENGVFQWERSTHGYNKSNRKVLCSHYPVVLAFGSKEIPDKHCGFSNNRTTPVHYTWFKNTSYTTAESFRAALAASPVCVVYTVDETPISLSEIDPDALAQYAALHSNYPNTTIYNDAGAEMVVKYYTPNTAVQMVHSPSDEGKVLTIDQHGCVILKEGTQTTLSSLGVTATATELNYVDGVTSNIQTQLNNKANASHGTHVSYSTTAPVMDGTASAGSATTVARSDHKHPTDTSRVSKTEFDTHTANTSKHITDTERTNWNAAKSHADSAHNYLPLTGGTLSGNTTINNAGARYRVTNGTNTTWFGMNSAGSTIGIYDETNKKYLIQHDGTNTQLNGNCTGNAGSATKVYTTATNSSTYKSYQIPFVSGDTSGNSNLLKNNGIKFDVRDGTTSQNGVALLLLGDTTVSGTDGNKSGGLYMYNSKGKYAAMIPAENTGNITITLPSATGTLATTADINALRDEFANGSW